MDNKEKIDNNNYYLLKSNYYIRKYFPSSKIFYLIMILFKYLGIISNSRIIEMSLSENNLSINKYLSNFFIFGKSFSIVTNNYQLICIIGAIILLIFQIYMILCFTYMKARYKNVRTLIIEKYKSINKNIKREENLFKIISYIILCIVFFHQYIIEYYFFGLYSFIYYHMGIFNKIGQFPDIYVQNLHDDLFDYFQNNNNHLLIFIINLIVIIVVILYLFIFLLFNSTKGLVLKHGFSYSGNLTFLITKIIILSFQPLFSIINLYENNKKIIIGIVINAIIIILCCISFLSCFHRFGYYPNAITNMSLFIEFFVFISALIGIILFFSNNKNDGLFIFVRVFIEIINGFFFMKLFLYFKDKYNLYLFSHNLFSKNVSEISKGGFYYYIITYFEYQKDKINNYQKMYIFILNHIINCDKIDCPEHILIPKLINNNYKSFLKNLENNKDENDEDKKENKSESKKLINRDDKDVIDYEKNKFSEKQFQMILEQEIINRIEYLYQSKKYRKIEDYIFIHLQYLISIKKNYSLALYYAGKYASCGIKWSFISQYFIYEYKLFIISIFYNTKNINNVDQHTNKYRKDNNFMETIINYFITSGILKKLIINSCNKLKIIFVFREDLHSPLVIKTYKRSRTKYFINIGKFLKKNIDKILYLLYQDIEKNNKKMSIELSYIISNFFIFLEGNIPSDLKNLLSLNFDIISIANKLNSGYKFLGLMHPLILSLTQNNTFRIDYFSTVICNRLGYFANELKNKDFHERLFPGIHFIKQHELLMKQFLFFDYNYFSKNYTFLKTKEGNLIRIKFNAKRFPTFFNDFLLIVGIDFIDDLLKSEINKDYYRYSFLLDDNFEFVSQTNNFFEVYEFNISMFNQIKINFFEFFNTNKKKFMENLKAKTKHLNETNYNLRRENDAFLIFKNINYENAFELRDISKLEIINNKSIYIQDKIYKKQILKNIPEISNLIEEYGLDFEWYQHIDNLIERLSINEIKKEGEQLTEYTKNIVSLGFSLNPIKINKNTISVTSDKSNDKSSKNYSNKSIMSLNNIININNNNNNNINNNENSNVRNLSSISIVKNIEEESTKKYTVIQNELITLEKYFDVVYTIKKIGSINYYIVDLYEKILNRIKINNLEDNPQKFKYISSMSKNNEHISSKFNDDNIPHRNINSDLKSSYIKSKTHFGEGNMKNKNLLHLDNEPVKSILIENESSNVEENNKNTIEQVKTLESDIKKNHIIKKYLSIKEKNIKNYYYLLDSKNNISHKSTGKNINKIKQKSKTKFKTSQKNINPKLVEKNSEYNNKNYNNIKDKVKNEVENASFIQKDKLEEFIKKNYNCNRNYILIIFILYLLTIISILIKFYLAKTNFAMSKYIIEGILLIQEIKSDLYTGSLIILSQCFRNKKEDMPTLLNRFENQMIKKSNELMDHLSLFEKNFRFIEKNRFISNIINKLYKNITMNRLDSDWSQKIEISYLLKEINYFGYALNEQSTQNTNDIKCNFEKNFYLLNVNSSKEIYILNGNNGPSFNQRFIYYIIKNILYVIKPIFYDILEDLIIAEVKIMDYYYNEIYAINCFLTLILIIIEIFIILKNRLDGKFIKELFIFLYHYEKNEIQFEFEIHYLEITAKEFNINNLILLENLKIYNYYYLYLMQQNDSNEALITEKNNNNIDNNKNLNKILRKKNNSNLDDTNSVNYNIKKDNNEQDSVNASILNNSSAIQLINKNNNNNEINNLKDKRKIQNQIRSSYQMNSIKFYSKKNINNNITNEMKKEINNIIDEEEIVMKDNIISLNNLKSNNNFIPYSILISTYFSIFILIIFFLIISSIIINVSNKKFIWEYSINLYINYLERIPKIVELSLSLYITVIFGINNNQTEFYYSKNEYKEMQISSLKYFSKLKNYDNSELLSSNIEDSYFANELYDSYKIKKNIEYCEKDNFIKNYFIETKLWNKKLSEENNFCINACLGGLLFFNKWIQKIDDFFTFIDSMVLACIDENKKANENGLNLEIDYILHEITYLYIDFTERIKINITEARQKFFENQNFKAMIKDLNVPFVFALGALYNAVYKDINDLSNYVSFFEIIFISVIFIVDIFLLFFLIIMIYVNENDKYILIFLSKIIKKN